MTFSVGLTVSSIDINILKNRAFVLAGKGSVFMEIVVTGVISPDLRLNSYLVSYVPVSTSHVDIEI